MTTTLADFYEQEEIAEKIEKEHKYPKGVQKVLEVLGDGRWHTNRDIIEKSNQIHITARILEARKQGVNIEYMRFGREHKYRWVK